MNSDDVEVRKQRTAGSSQADGPQAGDDPTGDDRAGGAYTGQQAAASIYARALPGIALTSGAAAFGASGLSLALLGLGVPFLMASLLAGACAGLLVYALARWSAARAARSTVETPPAP